MSRLFCDLGVGVKCAGLGWGFFSVSIIKPVGLVHGRMHGMEKLLARKEISLWF